MGTDAQRKFVASMRIDYEKWHDGVGYDLDAFDAMTPDEQREMCRELARKETLDWRDIQVLMRENSDESFDRVRDCLGGADLEQWAWALRYLAESDRMGQAVLDRNLARLLDALDDLEAITPAMMLVEQGVGEHTRAALWRGVIERPGVAMSFGARLIHLAGKSDDPYAWEHRPLLFRVRDEQGAAREQAIAELKSLVGEAGDVCG